MSRKVCTDSGSGLKKKDYKKAKYYCSKCGAKGIKDKYLCKPVKL